MRAFSKIKNQAVKTEGADQSWDAPFNSWVGFDTETPWQEAHWYCKCLFVLGESDNGKPPNPDRQEVSDCFASKRGSLCALK